MMLTEIGHVEAMFRYPVKSMAGEQLEEANLGWYGLDGDRRLAFRRMGNRSGMPWLTASKLPDLLLFAPHRPEDGAEGDLPTHIRTPDGKDMPVFGEDLATEVGRRCGAPVEMMQAKESSLGTGSAPNWHSGYGNLQVYLPGQRGYEPQRNGNCRTVLGYPNLRVVAALRHQQCG